MNLWVVLVACTVAVECPFEDTETGLCYDSAEKIVLRGASDNFKGTLIIPPSVTTIAQNAFKGKSIQGDVVISGSVDLIELGAFESCTFDGTVKIGTSVKTIKNQAFFGARFASMEIEGDGLTIESVVSPNNGAITPSGNVVVTGKDIFLGTQSIYSNPAKATKITLKGTNFTLRGEGAKPAIAAQSIEIDVSDSTFGRASTSYDLGYGAKYQAFTLSGDNNYFDMSAIGVGSSQQPSTKFWVDLTNVRTAGPLGNFECKLSKVKISVLEIGASALSCFKNAEVAELTIADGCEAIPTKAFRNLPVSGTIHFPSSVKTIASDAFDGTKIEAFVMSQNNGFLSTFDGILYSAVGDEILIVPPMKTGKLHFPSTLTKLPKITKTTFAGISYIDVDADNPLYFSENGILCRKSDGYVILCPRAMSGDVTVPTKATAISSTAFQGCNGFSSVTIGQNIKTIQEKAFSDVSVGTVQITAKGLRIGKKAFYTAKGSITITGDDILIDEYGAYLWTTSEDDNSLKITGTRYDIKQVSLKAANIYLDVSDSVMTGRGHPAGMSNIVSGIFSWYTSCKSIVIKGARNTLNRAPLVCQNDGQSKTSFTIDLRETKVDGDVGRIGSFGSVFISFASLGEVTLNKSTFSECDSMQFVLLESVKVIPWHCFYNAKYITDFTIPSSVTTIEREAFLGCSGISAFTVEGNNFKAVDGVVYDSAVKTLVLFPEGKSGTFSLPPTVEELWVTPNSFPKIDYFDVTGNERFESPDNKVLIDKIAKKIVVAPKSNQGQAYEIPANVEVIGAYAFSFCTWGAITIGKQVKTIEEYAFKEANIWAPGIVINCETLEIGVGAFYKITGRITIEGTGLRVKKDGLYVSESYQPASSVLLAATDYYVTITGSNHYFESQSLYASKLKVDVSQTTFQNWTLLTPRASQTFTAFYLKGDQCETYANALSRVSCDSGSDPSDYSIELTNLKAHDRLGTISNVGAITLSFSEVEGSPLSGITNAQTMKVSVGDGMTSLDDKVFGGDGSLTGEFIIPKGIVAISSSAFDGQDNIETFTVEEGNQVFVSDNGVVFNKEKTKLVLFPEGKTGEYTIPGTVTTIDPQYQKFKRITAFKVENSKTFVVDDGILLSFDRSTIIRCPGGRNSKFICQPQVSKIGPYSFHACTLSEALIGSSCRVIGEHAFESCTCDTLTLAGEGTVLEKRAMYYLCGDVIVRGSGIVFGNESIVISVQDAIYNHSLTISGKGHEFYGSSIASMVTKIDVSDSLFHTFATDPAHSQNIFHLVGNNNTFQNDAIGVSQESTQLEVDRVLRQTNLHAQGSIGTLEKFSSIEISFIEMQGEGTMENVEGTVDLSITFLEGLTMIPARAFRDVDELEGTIVIPSTVTDVNTLAFSDASRISEVRFVGESKKSLAADVLRIGPGAFANCGALARVIFERHENSVIIDDTAFEGHITGFEVEFTGGTKTPEPESDPNDDVVIIVLSVIVPIVIIVAIVIIVILAVKRRDKHKYQKFNESHHFETDSDSEHDHPA